MQGGVSAVKVACAMLERRNHFNGVVTYQSPLLLAAGVRHGFSTRIGGVSGGAFASLNLGNPGDAVVQDSAENLVENYRRHGEALGFGAGMRRAWVRQVHGNAVAVIGAERENEYGETLGAEIADRFSGQTAADAVVTAIPGVMLSVRVADCAPVLIAAKDGRVVAAVHAGWRGVVAGVIGEAVRVMREAGAEELIAAIGPGICADFCEGGDEGAGEFVRAGLAGAVVLAGGGRAKAHVDLQRAIGMQLIGAGIAEGRIDGNAVCTFRDAGDFYSHRRERGVTGRMAAVVVAGERSM